jgi:hypothetical protein
MPVSKNQKLAVWITAALLFHLSIYLYLDQILFAPNASFEVKAMSDSAVTSGQAYYSRNRRYMAIVNGNTVEIYTMPGKKMVRSIALGDQRVSYFKWLGDRDLALMGLYKDIGVESSEVVLTHIDPVRQGNEVATTIKNLPFGSKMVDAAFSTATNVIYMQVHISSNPDLYRVYRTDANHDLTRTYLAGTRIGRIGVLYDQDTLIYDNIPEDTVIARNGDGSWRVISPTIGKYRLVGVDLNNTIFIARLNKDGLVDTILKGKLQQSFESYKTLPTPKDIRHVKLSDVTETVIK